MSDKHPTHPKPHAGAPVIPQAGPQSDSSEDATSESAEPLRLDHFLKRSSLTESGGHAKAIIQSGEVKVNGEVDTRRRRKLKVGDIVEFDGKQYPVVNFPKPE